MPVLLHKDTGDVRPVDKHRQSPAWGKHRQRPFVPTVSGPLFTKWFWPDWLSDQGLRACSAGARGVWMDMLCLAAANEPYGYIGVNGAPLTPSNLARVTGVEAKVCRAFMAELEKHGVFSRDEAGHIYCRRMVREARATDRDRHNGRKGGNPALRGEYNEPGYVYFAGPRRDGWYKVGASIDPVRRVQKIRGALKDPGIVLIGVIRTENMGALEKRWHAKLGRPKHVGEWFPLDPQVIDELRGKFLPLKGRPPPLPGRKPLAVEPLDSPPKVGESVSEPNGSAIVAGGDAPRSTTPNQAMGAYNRIALDLSLPVAVSLNEKRRKAIGARLKEHPDSWDAAMTALRRAKWLQGQNDKGFKADLDFVIQPKSYQRLIEGFYEGLTDAKRTDAERKTEARRESMARSYRAAVGLPEPE